MIRNAWHMSGGEGWCENTTCRRVLVTHEDGKQTVEEIKNDLGIAADDEEAMKANLGTMKHDIIILNGLVWFIRWGNNTGIHFISALLSK